MIVDQIVDQALVVLVPVLVRVSNRQPETFGVGRMVLDLAVRKVPAHRCVMVIAAVPKPARRAVRWDLVPVVVRKAVVLTVTDADRKVAAAKDEVTTDVAPMQVHRGVPWALAPVVVRMAVAPMNAVALKLVLLADQADLAPARGVGLKLAALVVVPEDLDQVAGQKVAVRMVIVGHRVVTTTSRSNC